MLITTNLIKTTDIKDIDSILSELSNYNKIDDDYLKQYNISKFNPKVILEKLIQV